MQSFFILLFLNFQYGLKTLLWLTFENTGIKKYGTTGDIVLTNFRVHKGKNIVGNNISLGFQPFVYVSHYSKKEGNFADLPYSAVLIQVFKIS